MKRTIGTLTAIAAIALLAGGCGGSKNASTSGSTTASTSTSATSSTTSSGPLTKSAYDQQMVLLGKVLGGSFGILPSAANAKEGATKLLKVQADVRNLVKKLQAINPPKPVQAAHLRLIKAVSELADQFTPIIAKLRKGNFKAISQVASLPALNDIQLAVTKIESAGYTISSS